MTGVQITATINDTALRAALTRLVNVDGGLVRAALKNIGTEMVEQTRDNFRAQQDPDGHPWKALNPDYAATKKGSMILQGMGMAGGLMGSINWQLAGSDGVAIGTNKVYGAIHQLGGRIVPQSAGALRFRLGDKVVVAKAVTIPARPYLGVGRVALAALLDVIEDHIQRVWERT